MRVGVSVKGPLIAFWRLADLRSQVPLSPNEQGSAERMVGQW